METIQTIQFKRGLKSSLEAKLVGENAPKKGEPVFEEDTGNLKIGTGTDDYADLPYVGNNTSIFAIHDPTANQVLLYDSNTGKWINKDLYDRESIIYLADRGLTLKGYASASQGDMLVKDTTEGLAWVTPLSDTQLNQAVARAEAKATEAATQASRAEGFAGEADTAATTARLINEQTMTAINKKFWWGSLAEYNALEYIEAGTFYFISAEE